MGCFFFHKNSLNMGLILYKYVSLNLGPFSPNYAYILPFSTQMTFDKMRLEQHT